MTDQALIHLGECLEVLRGIPDASIDAVVTDPPYGLSSLSPEQIATVLAAWASGDREAQPTGKGFMGKGWDAFVPPPAVWDECFRVLKPGGHLLAFSGSRTFDLMGISIRLAGFEIRDSIAWLYGSGFPKSLDVSKAIDAAKGAKREKVPATGGLHSNRLLNDDGWSKIGASSPEMDGPDPVTDEARPWKGWGTALKPAFEPVVVARKPLEGTVAQNVLAHGTGALNIDATRIPGEVPTTTRGHNQFGVINDDGWKPSQTGERIEGNPEGRWPTNVILDESQAAELDAQAPATGGSGKASGPTLRGVSTSASLGQFNGVESTPFYGGEKGGASRFFYVAKAAKRERPVVNGVAHPTVKPLALMRHLVRLVTPPGGVVLDPFAGSGTTIEAAINEGFLPVGIEQDETFIPLIEARIERAEGY